MADIVGGLRKAIQDLLVPELKAIQVKLDVHGEAIKDLQQEMKELRKEMHERFEAIQKESAGLRQEMQERFEVMQKEIAGLKMGQVELQAGQREILSKLDLEKRVSKLEMLVGSKS